MSFTPTGWKSYRFGSLAHVVHGWAFKGSEYSRNTDDPIVTSIGNFDYSGGFRFASSTVKHYSGKYPAEYVLTPGDLLLVMTCQTEGGEILGVPGLVPDDGRIYLHNQRIGRVEIDRPDLACSAYLFQLARWSEFNRQLVETATGSKILHTSPTRIESTQFALPSLVEQEAIAEVLGALDDKIAANTRTVATADKLAAAHTRSSLSHDSAALVEIADIIMGSSPPGASYNEHGEGTLFHQGIRDFGVRTPKNRMWTTAPARIAAAGDTLLSVRAPVGQTNIAAETTCIGRGIASVRSKAETPWTLFHTLRDDPEVWAPYEAEGTVFGSINRAQLAALRVPLAPSDVREPLEERLAALESLIASTLAENDTLEATRDALLPALMSGKLRVRDAEPIVEEVM